MKKPGTPETRKKLPFRCARCGRPIPAGRWVQVSTGVYMDLGCTVRTLREKVILARSRQFPVGQPHYAEE